MKARLAKKLLKQYLSAQVVVVPPGSMLAIHSDDISEEELRWLRKHLDSRGVNIPVILGLSSKDRLSVVDLTSPACPSSSPPAASAPPVASDFP